MNNAFVLGRREPNNRFLGVAASVQVVDGEHIGVRGRGNRR